MDYKFQDKIKDNSISIAIVYKKNEYHEAKTLKRMIENRYKNGIKAYKIDPILVRYKNLKPINANIYYLFPADSKDIAKVIAKANIDKAITFSYLADDLKHGVMMSLNISKKIKPLLNLEAVSKHNITLRPMLINISTIFTNALKPSPKLLRLINIYKHKLFQV